MADLKTLIQEKQAELAKLQEAEALGLAVNPEKTPEQIAVDIETAEYQKRLRMFAASIDLEINRICQTGCVRLGDSAIYEKTCCDRVSAVLTEIKNDYLKLS